MLSQAVRQHIIGKPLDASDCVPTEFLRSMHRLMKEQVDDGAHELSALE